MDALDKFLPPELVDIIARKVWNMKIAEVNKQIIFNIVWVRVDYKFSFLVSNNTNYYQCLSGFKLITQKRLLF